MAEITAALALASDVRGPARRFTLHRVACIVNEHHGWQFWMTAASLAEQVGCDPGTIRQYLAEFVRDGWLEVVEQGGGRGNPTRYRWICFAAGNITVSDRKPRLARGVSEGETAAEGPETAAQPDPLLLLHERHKTPLPPTRPSSPGVAEGAEWEQSEAGFLEAVVVELGRRALTSAGDSVRNPAKFRAAVEESSRTAGVAARVAELRAGWVAADGRELSPGRVAEVIAGEQRGERPLVHCRRRDPIILDMS